jgi:selenocysteine lyase/cysteine desulfurase
MSAAQPLPSPPARRIVCAPRPVSALPALSPSMLLPKPRRSSLPFPFRDPRTQFFYLGRGAVWHAARLLGLQGEEVLVPAYHHGVEIEALLDAGVRLRFYGVKSTFQADLTSIGERITPKTKALYVIHYAGFPQPMDDLIAIARTRGLKVIEDCALSLLSSDGMRPLGSRGDAGIFCLYKTLPVPHGGALWMPRGFDGATLTPAGIVPTAHQIASSLLTQAEISGGGLGGRLRTFARSAARAARAVRPLPVDAKPVGHRTFAKGQENLAISPLSSHIVQRLDMEAIVDRRRRNYYALMARLRHLSTPMVHELAPGVCPLFYPFWCENKREVQAHLAAEGIESIDFWSEGSPLVKRGDFPEVDALRAHVLELPIHQDLDTNDIEAIAAGVRRALGAEGQS